jgi:hypothetical protein
VIADMPLADIDESGYIAKADFYSWYGLEDLDTLDSEYESIREIMGMTNLVVEKGKGKCVAEGATVVDADKKTWRLQEFEC